MVETIKIEHNYTDRLIIEKTNEKYLYSKQNDKYGIEYENSIVTKSCVNLGVKSINDPNIYTKQYRHFAGLKLLLIYNYNYNIDDISDYIAKQMDEGLYKVIPLSPYYYQIKIGSYKYFITYTGNEIILQNYKYQNLYNFFNKEHKNALLYSQTSSTDSYIGTFYISNGKNKTFELIIYSSEAEVDGFFEVLREIELSEYKALLTYKNFEETFINANSLLLYEIKSGNKPFELKEQMQKRCQFICKYLELFYSMQIFYIGFYKDRKQKTYKLHFNDSESSKNIINNETIDENNGSQNETKSIDKKESSSEESTKQDYTQDERIENKGDERDTKKNAEKKSDYKKKNNEQKNESAKSVLSKNKILKKVSIDLDFTSLNNMPAKIAVFQLEDEIFGEKLKYEKEELNLLGELRKDVTQIKNDIKIINGKIEGNYNTLNSKINQNNAILKAIAKKLNIDLKEIENPVE